MARIDNLKNFLSDIANAIKDKTGKTDAITPANFDTEIASIQTGGGNTLKIETQTYTPVEDEIIHVFTHNLGVVPDFVNIYLGQTPTLYSSTTNSIINVWGYRDGIFNVGNKNRYTRQMFFLKSIYGDGYYQGNYSLDDAIDMNNTSAGQILRNANSNSVELNGSSNKNMHLASGRTYYIIMISGMVNE